MSTTSIVAPVLEPVTVDQARLACHLDRTGDSVYDAAIDAALLLDISAARAVAETSTNRSIGYQTWEKTLDAFPLLNDIELDFPKVHSIVSVKYIDANTGLETTLATNQYKLDGKQDYQAWLLPAVGVTWPATADVANAVSVQYLAGFSDIGLVPPNVKKWILSAVKFSRDGGYNGSGEIPRDFNARYLSGLWVPVI